MSFLRYGLTEFEVGHDHPLVAEAHKERKHFHPCWCGSGKKYKKCHMLRHQYKPVHPRDINGIIDNYLKKETQCLKEDCKEKAINSHSIPKRGSLEAVMDGYHVYHFSPDWFYKAVSEPQKIGWKKASTFNGFCNVHDANIFQSIEQVPFEGTETQCLLVGYRSASHEFYNKKTVVDAYKEARMVMDCGLGLEEQISVQLTAQNFIDQNGRSQDELNHLKTLYEGFLFKGTEEEFNYFYIQLSGKPSVVSSGTIHTNLDCEGNILYEIDNQNDWGEVLAYGTLVDETDTYLIFSWPAKYSSCQKYIKSFLKNPGNLVPNIYQNLFWRSENTFFSKDWWNSLRDYEKSQVKTLALSSPQDHLPAPIKNDLRFNVKLESISGIKKTGAANA